jgi:pseudouridylate synthase
MPQMSGPPENQYLRLAPEVEDALAAGRPVVALESTLIAHGLPRPTNLAVAHEMEATIRTEGAVPATIALLDGHIVIGLSDAELERLATTDEPVAKASRRGLAVALAQKSLAATTVAGTLACAALAGIRVFATGGVGGAHRGAAQTFDISADLIELGRAPVVTVCAGIKAILDLPLTLEYLETQGVPVIGAQTDELPAFYCRTSGLRVPFRAETPAEIAAIARAQWLSGLGGGLLVACPIPEADALPESVFADALAQAESDTAEARVTGPAITPFLLSRIGALTSGTSVAANRALLLNNASWAARIATVLGTL